MWCGCLFSILLSFNLSFSFSLSLSLSLSSDFLITCVKGTLYFFPSSSSLSSLFCSHCCISLATHSCSVLSLLFPLLHLFLPLFPCSLCGVCVCVCVCRIVPLPRLSIVKNVVGCSTKNPRHVHTTCAN